MPWNGANWHASYWFAGDWYQGPAGGTPVGPVSMQAIRRLGLQLGLYYRPLQR